MRNKLRTILLLFGISLFLYSCPVMAHAEWHVNVDNSANSNLFIVGDSMGVRLAWHTPGPSYNATSGGQYIRSGETLIASAKYFLEQKRIIRNILRRQGSCIVVLLGTENDIYEDDWEHETLRQMQILKEKFQNIYIWKNGRKIHPIVFMTDVLPSKDAYDSVRTVNRMIRVSQGKFYINCYIGDNWDDYYGDDDVHYTEEGSRKLLGYIMRAVRKTTEHLPIR